MELLTICPVNSELNHAAVKCVIGQCRISLNLRTCYQFDVFVCYDGSVCCNFITAMHTLFSVLSKITHAHTRTTWVSRYQKGKSCLDFTEARDCEWQWHELIALKEKKYCVIYYNT